MPMSYSVVDAAIIMRTTPDSVLGLQARGAAVAFEVDHFNYAYPLAIQDRSFHDDGSLFYPDSRAFFDGYSGPYVPDSDVPPIWNPEFFGNSMVVNGRTWPFLDVEPRRYRFRVLNGCNARFLILRVDHQPTPIWKIGNEAGYLPAPQPALDRGGTRTRGPHAYEIEADAGGIWRHSVAPLCGRL